MGEMTTPTGFPLARTTLLGLVDGREYLLVLSAAIPNDSGSPRTSEDPAAQFPAGTVTSTGGAVSTTVAIPRTSTFKRPPIVYETLTAFGGGTAVLQPNRFQLDVRSAIARAAGGPTTTPTVPGAGGRSR
jgi:hypothetical protein